MVVIVAQYCDYTKKMTEMYTKKWLTWGILYEVYLNKKSGGKGMLWSEIRTNVQYVFMNAG